jgi:hypothetical protein
MRPRRPRVLHTHRLLPRCAECNSPREHRTLRHTPPLLHPKPLGVLQSQPCRQRNVPRLRPLVDTGRRGSDARSDGRMRRQVAEACGWMLPHALRFETVPTLDKLGVLRETPGQLREAVTSKLLATSGPHPIRLIFTSPPTMVATARPVTFAPSKGVLRLLDLKACLSMVHLAFGSMTVTSAGRPV